MNENWGSNVATDVVRHYPYQFTTYSVSDKRANVNKNQYIYQLRQALACENCDEID